jgi:predicted cupin superfamily sugar epimerase
VIERRMALADTIVFVDLPIWQHFAWAAERQHALRSGGASRVAPPTELLFETLWRVHTELRPRLIELIEAAGADATVHHLTSAAAIERFHREVCGGGDADDGGESAMPGFAETSSLAAGLLAEEVIERLGLSPHPEGGHYAETWRHQPGGDDRPAGSAIYYLLRGEEVGRWHRIDAAEVWHHYAGAPLELSMVLVSGEGVRQVLGANLRAGQRPQAVVPPQAWQQARSLGAWTLVGCTVSPAFLFERFDLAPEGWSPE